MILNFNLTGNENQDQLVGKAFDATGEFQDEIASMNNPRRIKAQLYLYSVLGRNLLEMFTVNHAMNFTNGDYAAAKVEAVKLMDSMNEYMKTRVIETLTETEQGNAGHVVRMMTAEGKPL